MSKPKRISDPIKERNVVTAMKIEVVETEASALPIGPYSQAIKVDNFVFVAGEKGIDPKTRKIVPGGIAAETERALRNIAGILEAAGTSLRNVVSTTVYLVNIDDFEVMNEVYAKYFKVNPPGRTTVGVNALPANALVEIQCIAVLPDH